MPASTPLLTLPDGAAAPLSIRAKALLFHDPASLALLAQIERLARSEATVLLVGETGTGKELIARHIYTSSGRRGPFVAVNCGAFSEQLIDAELFGHEAGAFTGATGARAGWFEAANGGTLFLDEIGDLPLAQQVKLLRVLQERQVVRLGSRRPVQLDVRLVAATNIDLQSAVAAQHFRADLYYRLSVAPMPVPPLRERLGDILPLAQHFLQVYGRKLGHARIEIDPDAQIALLNYPWPGNIRELENVIHFAVIVCQDSLIRTHDLRLVHLPAAAGSAARVPATAPLGTPVAASGQPFCAPTAATAPRTVDERWDELVLELLRSQQPRLFDRLEARLVHAAYELLHHNQVATARRLGVSRNSLRTLLRRHGLLGPCCVDSSDSAEAGEGTDGHEAADDTAAVHFETEPDAAVSASAAH